MPYKVLFVDDEQRVIAAMQHTLHKENYQVLGANSAREALTVIDRESIDVVVSDEKMPGMSGADFLVLVKQTHPDIIRILLTGHASSESVFKAINDAQIYRFMLKPCNALDLLITLRGALERKELVHRARLMQAVLTTESEMLTTIEEEHVGIVGRHKTNPSPHDISDTSEGVRELLDKIDAQLKTASSLIQQEPDDLFSALVSSGKRLAHEAAEQQPFGDSEAGHTSGDAGGDGSGSGDTSGRKAGGGPGRSAETEKTDHAAAMLSTSDPDLEDVDSVQDLKPIMPRSAIQTMLDDCCELKAMSPTVTQILKLTQNERCSMNQVVRTIMQDQAISLKILKLANSSAYTRGDPVDTVQKAVMRIGLSLIRQTVLNIAVIDQFSEESQTELVNVSQFWEHSVATGLISAEITRSLNNKELDIDAAFTAGLLHDIGRMVYLEMLGDNYSRVLRAARALKVPVEQVESRMLLINHADAMDRILHKWKFSRELIHPIALHQLSLGNIRRLAPNFIQEVSILALANRLAHALLIGNSGNLSLYPVDEFFTVLKLSGGFLSMIEKEIPEQATDIKLAMMANAKSANWPPLQDQLREQLEHPFSPLIISPHLENESLRIFSDRLRSPDVDRPNIGLVHINRGQERVPMTTRFKEAEKAAGIDNLPVIIFSPKGTIMMEENAMAGRPHQLLPFPVSISRIIEAFNRLAIPLD